ncbi:MAG: peptidyl-tRNA hydrolase Pth2 [Candidatus Methanomethylicia archaeon]|uniref:Peptidyl-tRNA hydrolase n=1 Tax=Candidatus Methanomethylicus mesodigestus TaxID=1867258 RepID=A0A7C3EVP7_9CREN|nr:peptidyl-tRNA hydrolase Pth2 [Candidatus Methanomethylicia archaeon]
MGFEYKQAIVVRQDLKMSKGKTAAQVAHAAISSFEAAKRRRPAWAEAWLAEGQKKVILKAPTLEEILSLEKSAALESLPFAIIADAGLTELEPGTVTCLGVGPAPSPLIDKVTGKLKLL